jgi:hypothetical protein
MLAARSNGLKILRQNIFMGVVLSQKENSSVPVNENNL